MSRSKNDKNRKLTEDKRNKFKSVKVNLCRCKGTDPECKHCEGTGVIKDG